MPGSGLPASGQTVGSGYSEEEWDWGGDSEGEL